MKKNIKNQKLFVVRKYVWAETAEDALRKESKQKADECWVDEKWKEVSSNIKDSIGFYHRRN